MLKPATPPLETFENPSEFIARHIGVSDEDEAMMLSVIGEASRRALIESIVPRSIARATAMQLPPAITEAAALAELKAIAQQNQLLKSFIGQGYYGTHTPGVILRNILENPAWYTAYTPYQAEISQGRMEALVNFQTMVTDLTGMAIANASMLDEATAAAEADQDNQAAEGTAEGDDAPSSAPMTEPDPPKMLTPPTTAEATPSAPKAAISLRALSLPTPGVRTRRSQEASSSRSISGIHPANAQEEARLQVVRISRG